MDTEVTEGILMLYRDGYNDCETHRENKYNVARAELATIKEEIDATRQGECGHNWDRRIWKEGCPVCAMKGGVAVRIGDLEMKNAKLRRLLHAYREKRLVDGLNGRTWDAIAHLEAEYLVAECEAALSEEEMDDG